ncbi:hypothetical protein ALON55S_08447 [Alishewanella longhuensis]
MRDLARKRAQLVRQKTTQLLSIKNLLVRNTGRDTPSYTIKTWTENVAALPLLPEQLLALQANWAVMQALEKQIHAVEAELLRQLKPCKAFQLLKTVSGIGDILSMTIYLETGDIQRFDSCGNFAPTPEWLRQNASPTARKKAKETGNVAIVICAGLLWRLRTLLLARMKPSNAFTSVSAQKV